MEKTMINSDKDARSIVEDLKQHLEVDEKGLSGQQVRQRHAQWGYNEIPMSVDQSALTGESLPAEKKDGDTVFSGSIARQGEMVALVSATGNRTYFGKTAKLVAGAKPTSHFQKAVLQIGNYLIYLSLSLVVVLVLVQHFRGAPMLEMVQFALILTVASIPPDFKSNLAVPQ